MNQSNCCISNDWLDRIDTGTSFRNTFWWKNNFEQSPNKEATTVITWKALDFYLHEPLELHLPVKAGWQARLAFIHWTVSASHRPFSQRSKRCWDQYLPLRGLRRELRGRKPSDTYHCQWQSCGSECGAPPSMTSSSVCVYFMVIIALKKNCFHGNSSGES